jgi:lipoprotein-anchoring transpeptidase ErfK/SrfK
LLPTPEPHEWPEEFAKRIEIAKRSTEPKIKEGKYIDVNLAAQVTTLFENGLFIASFINSSGAMETPTPIGTFQIHNKNPYALSGMFGVYLPYWMAFTEDGKYGFHDLIVWPEGHKDMPQGGKESERSLGNAVSPGCVRHDAKNSTFIYDWSDVGTPVMIY